jgi:hypothetical protein
LSNPTSIELLVSTQPAADEVALRRLAEFAGVLVCPISVDTLESSSADVPSQIACTAESLMHLLHRPGAVDALRRRLDARGGTLFVTGIRPSVSHLRMLEAIVPGVAASIEPAPEGAANYEVSDGAPGMRPFVGLRFGPVDRHLDACFVPSQSSDATPLVTIDGRPSYVKVERGGTTILLLASGRVLDIDMPAEWGQQPLDRFLQFVPFFGFLHAAFGPRCWHNPRQAACFVIDDPLLRKRYGFIDFDRLESTLVESRASANIAFIPWNYRRTDRRIARKFVLSNHRLSISVHGCDHTESEYGTADGQRLRSQTRRALARMQAHERLTGIAHNRIMVFPQGIFSKESLRALSDEGILAAVNSTIYPVDARPDDITFRDLLQIAFFRFEGVPLFMRRYPDRPEQFALDALLGRQVLIVEHHAFFKHGPEALARVARLINGIVPNVTWTDLEDVCASACLMRHVPGDGVHVQAFGSLLRFSNSTGRDERFTITNPWARHHLTALTRAGQPIDFEQQPDGTTCRIELLAGEVCELRFESLPGGNAIRELAPAPIDRLKVFVRRHLCELRDNCLARNPFLEQLARSGKSLLPRL